MPIDISTRSHAYKTLATGAITFTLVRAAAAKRALCFGSSSQYISQQLSRSLPRARIYYLWRPRLNGTPTNAAPRGRRQVFDCRPPRDRADGVLRVQERRQEPAAAGWGCQVAGAGVGRAEEQGVVSVDADAEHTGAVGGEGRGAAAGVRAGGARQRHQWFQPRAQGRRGRLRLRLPRLLPLRRRRPGRPRRQAPQQAQPPGAQAVACGSPVPGRPGAPEPSEAHRLLLGGLRRRQAPAAGLRVHAQQDPGRPSLQPGAPASPLENQAADHGRRRARPRLPPPGAPGSSGDIPGFQGLQRAPRRRLQAQAVGLRAGEGGPDGGADARVDGGGGHARVRGAGLHRDGAPDGEERRVGVRGGAVRDPHGAAVGGAEPAGGGAEAAGVGAAAPAGWGQLQDNHGPAAGRAVPGGRRARGGEAGRPVPRQEPQGAAGDEGGRGGAGAGGADGAGPASCSGHGQEVIDRWSLAAPVHADRQKNT